MHLPKRAPAPPLLAICALLVLAAVAFAAPARTIELSSSVTSASWDGSGVTGTPIADASVDDTLLKLSVGGSITVSATEFGPTGGEDIDINIFKADAAGEPEGDPIAEGAEGGEENVSVKNLKPGNYLVRAFAFVGVDATYKGSVKFVPAAGAAAPAEPAPGSPAPAPGSPSPAPSSPAPAAPAADALPEAAITKIAKAAKAKKFKKFSGTASDDRGVAKVEVALVLKKGKKCTQLKGKKMVKLKKCTAPSAFNKAKGTAKWSFKLKKALKKGKYTVYARAIDSAGQKQGGYNPRNKRALKLK